MRRGGGRGAAQAFFDQGRGKGGDAAAAEAQGPRTFGRTRRFGPDRPASHAAAASAGRKKASPCAACSRELARDESLSRPREHIKSPFFMLFNARRS